MRPSFKLVALAHDATVHDLPFDSSFVGPGVIEIVGSAPAWYSVRPQAEQIMRGFHRDFGASVRVTCITPNDIVPPFYIDEQGLFHDGLPPETSS